MGLNALDTQAIRDLLARRRNDVVNFVGTAHPRPEPRAHALHAAEVHSKGVWVTVVLRLLESAGLPPYEIVAGAGAH